MSNRYPSRVAGMLSAGDATNARPDALGADSVHEADDLLTARAPDWIGPFLRRAERSGSDIAAALDIAREIGPELPRPGRNTAERWAVLAALARVNVTVARVLEAHADALAIRAEAGLPEPGALTWGVFAAEGGTPLRADATSNGVRLTGVKMWCSLGSELDAALVTARTSDGRGLFAVDLREPGVRTQPAAGWVSRGLPTVTSVGLEFDGVPAQPVGPAGWYLTRPGFAWGGMGVAAGWHGAARGVADRLATGPADDLRAMHRGRVDTALHADACVLLDAAERVDDGRADGGSGARLALRVRAQAADTAETVLREVGHALGPAPLAFDEAHAARVADLTIYIRQHHGERDLAALGHELARSDEQPT